ncbi:hypothetical protein ACIQC5_15595 [Paenarthrobacter sp. NPDC092416]|uniref:hypothetical protein n=1 Tax=Paenarthrobacter sp. NPDC092416 TaxID=3364386 RepID=UPI00380ED6B8
MKPRHIWFAAVLLVAAIGGLVWFALAQSPACPAIRQANTSPIELRIASKPMRVQACFGEACAPHPVQPTPDGRWLVAQEPPFLAQAGTATASGVATPGSVNKIRVVVKEAGKRQRDTVFDIPTTGGTPGAQCPGPVEYLPVDVP